MKYLLLCMSALAIGQTNYGQKNTLFNDTTFLQPVEVNSVKATDKNPFAKTNLSKAAIKKLNIGQDLPFILNNTPSVVVNADAGTGIGYTGIRIRGTDATRINVTLNGIPYNDAESLGTFFVDIPDIASSASSIQIQRGVGTSANSAGSFGGSINVNTNDVVTKRNIELNSSAGSYGTFKNTLLFNSGIFNKHFTVDARLSNIRSDGYIERADARLQSYYISGAYIDKKNTLRLNAFTGKEITYQAYFGVNETALDTNRRYNSAGTAKPGAPYENEVDNYKQTHYQLFYTHEFNPYLKSNIAFFLTKGKGYYEQYRADEDLVDYNLPPVGTTTSTDLIRRLWLDNDFYGTIFSLNYNRNKTQLAVGGGYNRYEGNHFGEIIWAQKANTVPANYRWYDKDSRKYDASFYAKWTQNLTPELQSYMDVQVRNVQYQNNGFRKTPNISIDKNFTFFNPKIGLTYTKNYYKVFASYGRAVKEPNRDDFETATNQQPKPEVLNDFETGIEYNKNNCSFGANFYYMLYKNQLILSGKINDVGAYTRLNIPDSYRTGVELFANSTINKYVAVAGNVTISQNRVKNFTAFYDNYDFGGQNSTFYKSAPLVLSPSTIASLSVNLTPIKNGYINLTSKYVSKQYLDNTGNNNAALDAYFTQDAKVGYNIFGKSLKEVNIYVQAINVFSRLYEANGYSFSYLLGNKYTTENFYFPMAPANFVAGINIRL
ncbi:TonB-dependent receptor [Ferruginibacter yonginensis]|uniref:TonB-dependent receptor n=1 Tax=Ferruginibacter yonginensis TaxID=1310416 RepID=A0ABV8QQY9_9BACT